MQCQCGLCTAPRPPLQPRPPDGGGGGAGASVSSVAGMRHRLPRSCSLIFNCQIASCLGRLPALLILPGVLNGDRHDRSRRFSDCKRNGRWKQRNRITLKLPRVNPVLLLALISHIAQTCQTNDIQFIPRTCRGGGVERTLRSCFFANNSRETWQIAPKRFAHSC